MNHDPAMVLYAEHHERSTIANLVREDPLLAGHRRCHLMAGRFSYPLVEVGCFGNLGPLGPTGCGSVHRDLIWADADWLRLLVQAIDRPEIEAHYLAPFINRCWTTERLERLRGELGLTPCQP